MYKTCEFKFYKFTVRTFCQPSANNILDVKDATYIIEVKISGDLVVALETRLFQMLKLILNTLFCFTKKNTLFCFCFKCGVNLDPEGKVKDRRIWYAVVRKTGVKTQKIGDGVQDK